MAEGLEKKLDEIEITGLTNTKALEYLGSMCPSLEWYCYVITLTWLAW
jgi:hypothetical protein